MSLKNDNEQANLDEVTENVTDTVSNDEFGFRAEFSTETEYTTISGKEYMDVSTGSLYTINDFDIGETIKGYPEITIFKNMEKNENGEFKRKSQSVRLRLIDIGSNEYIDLYANIPRMDEDGFIENLNKSFNFMRTGFDLCYSFMRWLDETNVVTGTGEEINRINKINIVNVCKKIDSHDLVTVKVVKSNDPNYPSWIILNMENL